MRLEDWNILLASRDRQVTTTFTSDWHQISSPRYRRKWRILGSFESTTQLEQQVMQPLNLLSTCTVHLPGHSFSSDHCCDLVLLVPISVHLSFPTTEETGAMFSFMFSRSGLLLEYSGCCGLQQCFRYFCSDSQTNGDHLACEGKHLNREFIGRRSLPTVLT